MAKLLVFDDHSSYCEELMKCLSERHEVTFVSTLVDAVSQLGKSRFDMMVAAVYEQSENVFVLLQRLSSEGAARNVPFVCVRGPKAEKNVCDMDDAYRLATLMIGAKGYVTANDYNSVCPSLEQFLLPTAL